MKPTHTATEREDDEAVAKRQLDETVDHEQTLVIRRTRVRAANPDPIRADTPRLSWLNQQDGEEDVRRHRRHGPWNEGPPLLRGRNRRRNRKHRRRRERDHAGRRERRGRGRRLASFSRRGATAIGLRLADAVPG